MSMTPQNQEKNFAVSPNFVRPVVVLSLVLAAWLVPKRAELIKRLLEDGNHQRALEVAEAGAMGYAPGTQITILKALPAPETVEPAQPDPLERLRAVLVLKDQAASTDVTALIQHVNDAAACWDLVKQLGEKLDAIQLGKVYLAIGQSALAAGNPGLAADIWADGAAKGVHSESLLVREVTAYRWSGRPALALQALEAWQEKEPLPENLRELPFQLYRELNRPDKALALLLADLTPQNAKATQLEMACELANQADQMERVLPLLREYLALQPAGRASVQDLASRKIVPDAAWQEFTKRCALALEWGGQPLDAFWLHQKLAVLGDRDSLKRILSLNHGLHLDGDVVPVLQAVVPVADQPELTLTLAGMEADGGEYESADKHLAMWLKDHPRDTAALKQRAAVAEEQSRLDDALKLYEQALELDPKDVAIKKDLADLQTARGNFRAAFEIYENLPESAHNNLTLESYALLAESLAEYPAYNHALVKRMHRLKKPTTQDFLELGRSYAVIGAHEEEVSTYETGLRRMPHSHILRIELAQTLRLMDRYSEAMTVLSKREMKDDMQAMQLYIELACLAEDYASALGFLGRGIEAKFAFGPEVRLDLGQIYLQCGYATEADALFTSVPDEPALWPLLAAARFKAGNFASAETYQRKYLTALTVPDPQGWVLLGDIYQAAGRTNEAQAAYAKSLTLMADKLEDDDEMSTTTHKPNTPPKSASLR